MKHDLDNIEQWYVVMSQEYHFSNVTLPSNKHYLYASNFYVLDAHRGRDTHTAHTWGVL